MKHSKHPWSFYKQYGKKFRISDKRWLYAQRKNPSSYWNPRNKVTLKEVSSVNYNYKYLKNNPRYGKYYEEYKVHCWVPPLTVLPPRDYSIRYDGL